MKRRSWAVAAVGAAAAVAGAAWWRFGREPAVPPAPPLDVWSLRFERPEGGTLEMAALRGQPTLLNFWATWCPPCIVELPLLNRFQKAQPPSGWRVVGLAVDGPTPVREFLKRLPLEFAVGLAGLEGVELARALGNETGALPFTVIFAPDGSIRERKLGALKETDLERFSKAV